MTLQITKQEQEQELYDEYRTNDQRIFRRNKDVVLDRARLEGIGINHAAIGDARQKLAAAVAAINAKLPKSAVRNVPRRAAQKRLGYGSADDPGLAIESATTTAQHALNFVRHGQDINPTRRFYNDKRRLDDPGIGGYISSVPPRTAAGPSFWQIRNSQTTGLTHEHLRKRALERVKDNSSWLSDGLGFVGKQVGVGLAAGSLMLWLPKPSDAVTDGAGWVWNHVAGNPELAKRLRLTSMSVAMQVVSVAGTVYEVGRGRISKREFAKQMGRATTGVFVLLLPIWIAPAAGAAVGSTFGMTVLLHCTISLTATGLNAAVDYTANRYIMYTPTETEVLLARFEAEARAEHAKQLGIRRAIDTITAETKLLREPPRTYTAPLRWAVRAIGQNVPWATIKKVLAPFKGLFLSLLIGYAFQQIVAHVTGLDFSGITAESSVAEAAAADPRRSWVFQKLIEPGAVRRLVEVPFDAAMATIVVPALVAGSARATEMTSAAFMRQLRLQAYRRGWTWVPLNKSVPRALFQQLVTSDYKRYAQIASISATVYEHFLMAVGTEAGRKVNYDALMTITDRDTVPHIFEQIGRIDAAIDRAPKLSMWQRISLKWQLMTPEHLLASLTTHAAMRPGDVVYTSLKPGTGDAFKFDGRSFVNVRTGAAFSNVEFAAQKHKVLSVDIAHRASDIDADAANMIAKAMGPVVASEDDIAVDPDTDIDIDRAPDFVLNQVTGAILGEGPAVGPLAEHLERLGHTPQLREPTRVRAHWPTGVVELFPDFAAAAKLAEIAKTNPDMAEALGSITQRMAAAQVLGEKAEDRRVHDLVALDREHAVRMGGPANMGQLIDSNTPNLNVLDAWALHTVPDAKLTAVADRFGTQFGDLGHRYRHLLGGHAATRARVTALADDIRLQQADAVQPTSGTETAEAKAQRTLWRIREYADLQDADIGLQQGFQKFYSDLHAAETDGIHQRFEEHLAAGDADREQAIEQLRQLDAAVSGDGGGGLGYIGGGPGVIKVDVERVRAVQTQAATAMTALKARTDNIRVHAAGARVKSDFQQTARFARQAEWAKTQVQRTSLVKESTQATQAVQDFALHTDAILGMAASFDMDLEFLTEMAAAMASNADVGLSDLQKLGQMLKDLQQKQSQQVGQGYQSLHTALQECDAVYANADIVGTELRIDGAAVSAKLKRQCFSTPLAVGAVGWLVGGGLATVLQSAVMLASATFFGIWAHYMMSSAVGGTLVAKTIANIVTRTMEINTANNPDRFDALECDGLAPCPPGCDAANGCDNYPDHVVVLSQLVETVLVAAIQLDGTGVLQALVGPRPQVDVLFSYSEVGASLYKGGGGAGSEVLQELFKSSATQLDPAVRQARADAAGGDADDEAGDAGYVDRLWMVIQLATSKGPAAEAASTMLFGNRYSAARRLWDQYLVLAGDDALDGVRRLAWALTGDAALR